MQYRQAGPVGSEDALPRVDEIFCIGGSTHPLEVAETVEQDHTPSRKNVFVNCLQEDIAQVSKAAIFQSNDLETVAGATCRDTRRKALVREDEDNWLRLDLGVQVLAAEEDRVVRFQLAGLAGQGSGVKAGCEISFCGEAVDLEGHEVAAVSGVH